MISMEVKGVDDIKHILSTIAPKRAQNLIRATVRGIAAEIVVGIKQKLKPRSDTGNLIRSVKVKAIRGDKFTPSFKVVFSSGKDAKYDGFYWRFLEHGTKNSPNALNFVRSSRVEVESELDRIMSEQFVKKLESAIKRELKIQASSK